VKTVVVVVVVAAKRGEEFTITTTIQRDFFAEDFQQVNIAIAVDKHFYYIRCLFLGSS
jgi:ribosomal protein L31